MSGQNTEPFRKSPLVLVFIPEISEFLHGSHRLDLTLACLALGRSRLALVERRLFVHEAVRGAGKSAQRGIFWQETEYESRMRQTAKLSQE
jgi:hypothetical protein